MQISVQSSAAWNILTEFSEFFEGQSQYDESNWIVSTNFLLNLLERYFIFYGKIYLVIDALDESTNQDTVLEFLLDLLAHQPGRINIIITSRQERNIQQSLEASTAAIIAVTADKVDHDVKLHIQKRIALERGLQKFPHALRDEIEQSLSIKASGMYCTPPLTHILGN
jgi:hypothetical protein